jgi:capsular polysaccharide biosynthesis protein
MELRHYARIVWRSWPLVVGLPLLVGLLTAMLWLVLPQPYVIEAAVLVTQRPIASVDPGIELPDQNNYYSWVASEYIVDDLLNIVVEERFADDVAAWLRARHNLALDPERISHELDAERKHRMLYITVTWPRQDETRLIAQAAITVLQERGLAYWNREQNTTLAISEHKLPEEAEPAQGLFGMLFDVALRSILAVILAVGLAFLRHYLDQSLREQADVEALGLEVIGTIPRHSRTGRQPPRRAAAIPLSSRSGQQGT